MILYLYIIFQKGQVAGKIPYQEVQELQICCLGENSASANHSRFQRAYIFFAAWGRAVE